MTAAQLNTQFAIANRLQVVEGAGGFPVVNITTDQAQAKVSVYAGQVLSFQPQGQADDLLFLSKTAYYANGKAIKGGVPICWPWFGPDPEGKGRPGHGFVRNRPWNLLGTAELPDGRIQVRLGLVDTDETRAVWDHAFELELLVTVGHELDVALTTRNKGDAPFPLTQGLHTYLAVGDIAKVKVHGLDGFAYLDNLNACIQKVQQGAVVVSGEMDSIYLDVENVLEVEDISLNRRITITSRGSASAVVWNPWAVTAASMADLADDDYTRLLCVEATNTRSDTITVAPGASHTLAANYALSSL